MQQQRHSTYIDAVAVPSPSASSPKTKKALPWRMPSSAPAPLPQAVTSTAGDADGGSKAAPTLPSPPHGLYDVLSVPPQPPLSATFQGTAEAHPRVALMARGDFASEPPQSTAAGDVRVELAVNTGDVVTSVPLAVTVAAVEAIPQLSALPPPMQQDSPPSAVGAAAPSVDGHRVSSEGAVPPPPQGWAVSPVVQHASSPTAAGAEMPPPLTPGKISALRDAYSAVQTQRGKFGPGGAAPREPRTPSSNGSTRGDATGSSGGRMWGNSPQAAPAVRWGSHSLNATARIFQPSAASLAAAGQPSAAASSAAGPAAATSRFSYSYAGSASHVRTASGGGGSVRMSPQQHGSAGLGNSQIAGGAFARSPPQSYPATPPMSGSSSAAFPKSGPFAATSGGGSGTSTPPYGHSGFPPPSFVRPRPAGGHSPTLGPSSAAASIMRGSAAPAHGGSFAAGSSMGDGDSIVIQNVMVPVGLESEADVRDFVHFGDGYYYAADGTAFVRPHAMLDDDDDDASMASSSDNSTQRFSRRRRGGGGHQRRRGYGGGGGTGDSFGSSACSGAGGSAMGQSLDEGERAWLEEQIRGTAATNVNSANNGAGGLF